MNVFELSHLAITRKLNTKFVPVNEILRAEFFGSETRFHLKGGDVLVGEKSVEHYAEALSDNDFVFINRLDLVNLNHIQRMVSEPEGRIVLSEEHELHLVSNEEQKLLNLLKTIEIG